MMIQSELCEQIYRDYRDKIFHYIKSKVRSLPEAEDLLSCVFLKISENIAVYDSDRSSLSTWVYTITHNIVCNYYRDKARHIQAEYIDALDYEPYEQEELVDCIIKEENLEQLVSVLEQLSERQRDLIILRYYKGFPLKKVAEIMKLSYGNAKYIHHETMKTMEKLLNF